MKGGGLRNEEEGMGLENVLRCKVFGVRPFLPSFLGWDGMGYSSASFYKFPPLPFPPFVFLSAQFKLNRTHQASPSIHPFFLSFFPFPVHENHTHLIHHRPSTEPNPFSNFPSRPRTPAYLPKFIRYVNERRRSDKNGKIKNKKDSNNKNLYNQTSTGLS